jgi:cell envelope opacity-associated protein A
VKIFCLKAEFGMMKERTEERKFVMRKAKEKKVDQESQITLKDALNEEILKQLKMTQKELEKQEEMKKKAEAEKKREERKRREKNKSFEELLNESRLDWKDFK